MNVSVVIPNWNGRQRLETLLKQLSLQTSPISEVIVVDNGSQDGSAECAERLGARVIRFSDNRGFSVAVNRGVSACDTELVAILNNDVEPRIDWLERLQAQITPSHVWFATGKLLNSTDESMIDGAFDAICRGACAWRCGQGRADGAVWNISREIQLAPFTALLMKVELFQRIGGLDERFESYLEDVDFGVRCASNGYTGRYVPDAVALHAGSATLGYWNARTTSQIARNQLLLVAKHYPVGFVWKYGWPIAMAQLLWGLVAFRHGAGLPYLRGKLEGLRMFSQFRGSLDKCGDNNEAKVADLLNNGEKQIRDLQQETGFDWYWRIYFKLS